MRRKPQQTRAKLMVDAIVEAGFISLSRNGLDGTTTRHIADIAGISVGTLYQYFDNKEAVYDAMHARFVAEVIGLLRNLTPELVQKDVKGLVELMLHRFSDWLRQNDGRYLAYARHIQRFDRPEHGARVERALLEIASQYVMRHPQLISLRGIPAMLYIMINGGVFVVVRYLSSPSPSISFEQLVAGLANMVTGYVATELG
ncbi:MAG: TetR/AcrR family transcriptional regulator [Nevskia sp.]|nr:TetR/AcrR family transcriptional regulator [Nevskia sp.]